MTSTSIVHCHLSHQMLKPKLSPSVTMPNQFMLKTSLKLFLLQPASRGFSCDDTSTICFPHVR